MRNVSLAHLVVTCKDYAPMYNWYLRKSDGYYYFACNEPKSPSFDKKRFEMLESNDDFVLMPECHNMEDEEAACVIREWCIKNDIRFLEDMELIEDAYGMYYLDY